MKMFIRLVENNLVTTTTIQVFSLGVTGQPACRAIWRAEEEQLSHPRIQFLKKAGVSSRDVECVSLNCCG